MPNIIRTAIFYDGAFFQTVNKFYRYHHEAKRGFYMHGLHNYFREYIAAQEGHENDQFVRLVESHLFKGRDSAAVANEKGRIQTDRAFDSILETAGVQAHYNPLVNNGEKGVDVSLALEAYDLALNNKIDVIVLFASDSDFVPLVNKLSGLGVRVVVPIFNEEYEINDEARQLNTSKKLIKSAVYKLELGNRISDFIKDENKAIENDKFIEGVLAKERVSTEETAESEIVDEFSETEANYKVDRPEFGKSEHPGKVIKLSSNFGFIKPDNPECSNGSNIFFHESELADCLFDSLESGAPVIFKVGYNDRGVVAGEVRLQQAA